MGFFNRAVPFFAGLLLVSGCATIEAKKKSFDIEKDKSMVAQQQSGDQRNCERNYTITESLAAGRNYSSHEDFPSLTKEIAIRNVVKYMVSSGWTIFNTDTDLGVVSANTDIMHQDGRVAQFSVIVTEQKDGTVRVECSTYTVMRQDAYADDLKREFCRLLAAVAE
jgi:hypothetical protein